jgi:5-methyltetrahydropteroyltriglutamate--homocysteine methyltransferase
VTIGIRADRYRAEVPTVVGPIRRPRPVHADDVRFARAHTSRRLKFTLPGPMTIVDTLADEHYRDRRRLAFDFARVLNEEARDLARLGVDVVQFDEPAETVFPLLAASRIDQVSLECANSRVPLSLLRLLDGKHVMVGAIDVATDAIETPDEVAATLRAALAWVPAERLLPSTNCGMVPLSREVARGKLSALAAGAAILRRELGAGSAR